MAIARPRFYFRSHELKGYPTSITPPPILPNADADNQSPQSSPMIDKKDDAAVIKPKK